MKRKHNILDKLGNFVTGKGFYLVVLVCVAAIGLSGYYLIRSVGSNLDQLDQPAAGTVTLPPEPSAPPRVTLTPMPVKPPLPTAKPTQSPVPSVQPTVKPTEAPQPSKKPAPLVFTWPVNGTIVTEYSVDALAYDETMGDWRTHSGVDIAAPVGTKVMAAAAGVVSALYEDDFMGTTVAVDHGNGLISVYSNLAVVPTVKVGDSVTTGHVIGTIGQTAVVERDVADHLHFAMFRNNAALDPLVYLPAK